VGEVCDSAGPLAGDGWEAVAADADGDGEVAGPGGTGAVTAGSPAWPVRTPDTTRTTEAAGPFAVCDVVARTTEPMATVATPSPAATSPDR
jgi:hypothetical protein